MDNASAQKQGASPRAAPAPLRTRSHGTTRAHVVCCARGVCVCVCVRARARVCLVVVVVVVVV